MNKLKQYDYRFDNSAIDQNGNLKNNLVVTTPEVQVYAHKNNQYPYSSTYDPNGLSQFANIATLGGLNNLSPTQWARRKLKKYVKVGAATTAVAAAGTAKVIMSNKNKKK